MIELSILVASVPSRIVEAASGIYAKLVELAGPQPVEVLMFADNKQRTLGEKMNGLLSLARGTWLTFVDDDDDVTDDFVERLMAAIRIAPSTVDVINFGVDCTMLWRDGRKAWRFEVRSSVHYQNDEARDGVIVLRKPLQVACWRSSLAKSAKWADAQYQADAHWALQLWPKVRAEAFVPGSPIYRYRWSEAGTEAK